MTNIIPPYSTSTIHHICEHCGITHLVYKKDIERGKGTFCSLKCAAYHRLHTKYNNTCKHCNIQFKTIDPSAQYCSIDCQEIDINPQ